MFVRTSIPDLVVDSSNSNHVAKAAAVWKTELRHMHSALYVAFGLVLGALIAWVVRSLKPPPMDRQLEEELRDQPAVQDRELTRLRNDLNEAPCAGAAAQAAKIAAAN